MYLLSGFSMYGNNPSTEISPTVNIVAINVTLKLTIVCN
jgi:hypothetical protein